MKYIAFVIFTIAVGSCYGQDKQDKWNDMDSVCVNTLKQHLKNEIEASLSYLQLGARFAQDQINLPGLSKLFLDSASEERQHAIKMMDYLSMRGDLIRVADIADIPFSAKPKLPSGNANYENIDGLQALGAALDFEKQVTSSIKNIIKVCDAQQETECVPGKPDKKCTSSAQDYHVTDWLTVEYLDEQYKGQRDLAGKRETLEKLVKKIKNKNLATFIFDKKLLGIDI